MLNNSEIPLKARNRYDFKSPEIIKKVNKLTLFFQQKHFAPDTIKTYCNYTSYFLDWQHTQEINTRSTTYNHLLQFVNHCQKQGRNPKNINMVLTAVRHYFDMLQLPTNPATGLYLRGEIKTIPNNLLSTEQLDQLYDQHPVYNERTQRNKAITGLYVYQGIGTDELKKLEPQHIQLQEGNIYIPSTKQTYNKGGRQSRTLKLKANQILALQEYLLVTRPKIIQDIQSGKREKYASRKPKEIKEATLQNQLFISLNGSEHIKNSVKHLMQDLRKIDPQVKDGMQLRKSVIVNWLKEKDIRQVQYMAGHSSISSTEKYRAANLEELEEALKMHHPLR